MKKNDQTERVFGDSFWKDRDGNYLWERKDIHGNKYYEDQYGNKIYIKENPEGELIYYKMDIWSRKFEVVPSFLAYNGWVKVSLKR